MRKKIILDYSKSMAHEKDALILLCKQLLAAKFYNSVSSKLVKLSSDINEVLVHLCGIKAMGFDPLFIDVQIKKVFSDLSSINNDTIVPLMRSITDFCNNHSVNNNAASIATMLHDIKNLFQPLIGYIELAQISDNRKFIEENMPLFLSNIQKAQNTLEIIVSGQNESEESVSIDMWQFITGITSIYSDRTTIITDLAEEDKYYTYANPDKIRSVLDNLCLNAIQAMEESGILNIALSKVSITNHSGLKNGPYLCLKVSDNGKGMTEETKNSIFNKMGYTTKPNGNGVGLYAVQKIIKAHNGLIEVDSELGKETTFTVYLPESAPEA
ncbi:ATP-binding protein [Candidatus Margulisiibacteriota bacterium]